MQLRKKFALSCSSVIIAASAAACSVSPAPEDIEGVGSDALVAGWGGVGVCNQADPYEKNNRLWSATELAYYDVYAGSGWGAAYTSATAFICKKDQDWYFMSTSDLPFMPGWLSIRAQAAGASYCPVYEYEEDGVTYTWGYDPPAGPESTIQIDVYSAGTLQLVASAQSNIGRIFLDTYDGPMEQDLYLRVRGPKEAYYGYNLSVRVQTHAFEDECEY
ncbi:hypothetical protein [Polyangium sp. 6x1]|uniref:hypothetical protein n=1 Tax=Polyangium sp. 6x1 TaxID=3042689 RepID=UPI00248320D1|nr:hypothetical protein [Polyangium sp. 6x1]MDI1447929.1 hypothetical protein [Polyangium sp. 6x1]